MVIERYHAITDALRKTVGQTIAAGADPQLLEKAFADYGDSLEALLDEDLPLAPEEMDAITAATDTLQKLADTAAAIDAGACQPIADMQPSAEAVGLLHAAVELGEIALHAMATDFAAPLEKGEQEGEGEALAKLALGEGEDAEEMLVKTVLPEGPRELLVHPSLLGDALAEMGMGLLTAAGVNVQPLFKKAPPFRAKGGDPNAEEEDEDEEGEADEDEDGEEDEEDMEDMEEGDVPEAMDDPLENIAKLSTAIVVEVGAMREMMGPAAPPQMPQGQPEMDENGEPMGEQPQGDPVVSAIEGMGKLAALIATMADSLQRAAGAGDEAQLEEEAAKAEAAGDLAKREVRAAETNDQLKKAQEEIAAARAQVEALAKQNRDKEAELARLRAEPVPGKAVVGAGNGRAGTPLAKQADGGADFDPHALQADLDKLAAMSPEEQSAALFKRALSNPIPAR